MVPRNVKVWNTATQPATEVAGFNQHGTAWRLFPAGDYGCATGQPPLESHDPAVLQEDRHPPLLPFSSEGEPLELSLVDESFRPRILSLDNTGTPKTTAFRDRVRERDERCCVTGALVRHNFWAMFRASHIFPIAHRDAWDLLGLSRFIQDGAPEDQQSANPINSVQNGLLLRSDIHALFDANLLGINPDDGYRIVEFLEPGPLDGGRLWINENVAPKYRPSDTLLREHFWQCVLANVKGTGRKDDEWLDPEDPVDLSNFSRWGESLGEGQPSRLELELRSRLNNSAVDA